MKGTRDYCAVGKVVWLDSEGKKCIGSALNTCAIASFCLML
jgi:hypothetical protein